MASKSTIDQMPHLVLKHIFNFLPDNDKMSCRLVCKDWTHALDNYCKEFTYNVTLNNENLQHVLHSGVPITKIQVTSLDAKLPLTSSRPLFTPFVKSLNFSTRVCVDGPCRNGAVSEDNMKKLLENCVNLEYLKFSRLSFMNVVNSNFFRRLSLDKLKCLQINLVGSYSRRQHNAVCSITRNCLFPSLSGLVLDFSATCDYTSKQYYKLYVNTYEFIGRHNQNLKDLSLLHTEEEIPFDSKDLKLISEEQSEKIYKDLQKVSLQTLKLSTLKLKVKPDSEDNVWGYGICLVISQTRLTSLRIFGSKIHTHFQDAIQNSYQTLVELDTYGIQSQRPSSVAEFDLTCLKNATNLKYLTIGRSVCSLNIEMLPKSIIHLTWCEQLEMDELLWIIHHLTGLKRFVLRGFEDHIIVITLALFEEILLFLPNLEFLHLDCSHEMIDIARLVNEKANQGQDIKYTLGGRISIGRRTTNKVKRCLQFNHL